jgi:hypothetical protein
MSSPASSSIRLIGRTNCCHRIGRHRPQRVPPEQRDHAHQQINKVHHVTTITRVAEDLGEDEEWQRDVANEVEIEDGAIWVYGVGEDGVKG